MPNLEQLLQEETKGSRIQIPESIYKKIQAYKDAYKEYHKSIISREKVMILMMSYGDEGLQADTKAMNKAVKASKK